MKIHYKLADQLVDKIKVEYYNSLYCSVRQSGETITLLKSYSLIF